MKWRRRSSSRPWCGGDVMESVYVVMHRNKQRNSCTLDSLALSSTAVKLPFLFAFHHVFISSFSRLSLQLNVKHDHNCHTAQNDNNIQQLRCSIDSLLIKDYLARCWDFWLPNWCCLSSIEWKECKRKAFFLTSGGICRQFWLYLSLFKDFLHHLNTKEVSGIWFEVLLASTCYILESSTAAFLREVVSEVVAKVLVKFIALLSPVVMTCQVFVEDKLAVSSY